MPTPSKNYNIAKPDVGGQLNTWGATNNQAIDTTDDILYRHSVPRMATSAARDAAFPAPLADQRVARVDTGYFERYDKPTNKWLSVGVTREAGPVVTPLALGADSTGVNDTTAKVLAADAATTGRCELDPGTYLIAGGQGTITLNAHWRPERNANFKIGNGTKLKFAGPYDPGHYKTFDCSLGGTVDFTGNVFVEQYSFAWWGAVGNRVTNDATLINQCLLALPHFGHVHMPLYFLCAIGATLTLAQRKNIRISTAVPAVDSDLNAGAAGFVWIGADAGTMFAGTLLVNGIFEGLQIQLANSSVAANVADVGMDFDGAPANGFIGSANKFFFCYFYNPKTPGAGRTPVGLRISAGTSQNHEGYGVYGCKFLLNPSPHTAISGSMINGSNLLNCPSASFNNTFWLGVTVKVPNAAAGPGLVTATISAVNSPTQVQLSVVAGNSSGTVSCVFIFGTAIGIQIGSNFNDGAQAGTNAKMTIIGGCQFNYNQYGVYLYNGSVHISQILCTTQDTDWFISGCSDACSIQDVVSEGAFTSLLQTAGEAVSYKSCSNDYSNVIPGGFGMFRFGPNVNSVTVASSHFSGSLQAGAILYDYSAAASNLRLTRIGNEYGTLTRAQLGDICDGTDQFSQVTVISIGEYGISDEYRATQTANFSLGPIDNGKMTVCDATAGPMVVFVSQRTPTGFTHTLMKSDTSTNYVAFLATGTLQFVTPAGTPTVVKLTRRGQTCSFKMVSANVAMITSYFDGPPLVGSVAWTPGLIANGGSAVSPDISVLGAALGDRVDVSFNLDLQGCSISGYVRAADNCRAVITNNTGGGITPGAGSVKAEARGI